MTNIKGFVLIALTTVMTASAQKLPSSQKVSVLAPRDISIDGLTTEWHDTFFAHQLVSRVYYTLSNDNSNLYLTIKADGPQASRKIFHGGITLAIYPVNKKEAPLSITFPALKKKVNIEQEKLQDSPIVYKIFMEDTIKNKTKLDSLISVSNRQLTSVANIIQIRGSNEIVESSIPLKNQYAIQAAGTVNSHMECVLEFALPLKYLYGRFINSKEMLRYDIKLNSTATIAVSGFFDPPILMVSGNVNQDDIYVMYDTDFSGDYTLAKK